MDYKDLTAILLKITGAALIFIYLPWLPASIPIALNTPFNGLRLFFELLPTLTGLAIAFVIFKFPASIANKLISGPKLTENQAFVTSLQVVALRLIGIYHTFMAITDLAHHFSVAVLTPRMYKSFVGYASPQSGWTPELVGWTIATFIELMIALWFVLGAEGILRLVEKVRGRGDF